MAIQLSECSELIDIQFKAFSDFQRQRNEGQINVLLLETQNYEY